MTDEIKVDGCRYYPLAWLDGDQRAELLRELEDRQSLISSRKVSLKKTCGVYITIAGRPILFVIDPASVMPGSDEWGLIGEVAARLESCAPMLSATAQAALASLHAVIFVRSPNRSYADVKPNSFVYDVDEFRRIDGGLVSVAFVASNIVHDANHIRMYDAGEAYTGEAAEAICWRLQVDNAQALGLEPYEVTYLQGLIDNPDSQRVRIASNPLSDDPVAYACAAVQAESGLA